MARDKESRRSSREDRDEQEQGTKDIETSLEEIDDWEDTEETSFAEVDDGKYQAKILSGTINKSKSSERLQVSWELEIMNTKFAGRHVFKHDGIDTPEARGWFRGGLARLGVDWPKSASELPDILEELKDTFCEIRAVTKKDQDRPNVYFNSALDEKDIEEPDVEEKEEKRSSKSREKDEDEDEDEKEEKEERKSKRDKDEDEDEDEKPKKKKKDEDENEDEKEPEEKVKTNFNDDDMRTRHKERIKEIAEDFRYKTTDYKCLTDCLADIAEVELGVEGDFDNAQDLLNEVEDAIDEKEKKEKAEEEKGKGSSRRK